MNKGWPKHSHAVLFTYFLRLLSGLDEEWLWLRLWPIKPMTLLSLALYRESASPWDSLIPDSPFPPISVTRAPRLSSHLKVFKCKQNRIGEFDIWQVENGGVKVVSGRSWEEHSEAREEWLVLWCTSIGCWQILSLERNINIITLTLRWIHSFLSNTIGKSWNHDSSLQAEKRCALSLFPVVL